MQTKGHIAYAFRQAATEALSYVVEYEAWLLAEFSGVAASAESKKKEIDKVMSAITDAESMIPILPEGQHQAAWTLYLEELKKVSEAMQSTREEVEAGMQFMEQLHITQNTKLELEAILKKHEGDCKREFIRAMQKHGIDQQIYHSGMIVGVIIA